MNLTDFAVKGQGHSDLSYYGSGGLSSLYLVWVVTTHRFDVGFSSLLQAFIMEFK